MAWQAQDNKQEDKKCKRQQQQKPAISTYCSTIKSCDNMVDLWPMEFATSKWFDGKLLTGATISRVPK
jgi:hypothetical protein